MKAVIQRVLESKVRIAGKPIASIGLGLVILLGVENGDDEKKADTLAKKCANLRIFADEQEKMNLSIVDVRGEAIVVSQFTLLADTRKGNRPSFVNAAAPDIARLLVNYFCAALEKQGVTTQSGEFGAHMLVDIQNDGPVTICLEA